MPGFAGALMGWTAMFVLNFGWLANVAYFLGLLMFLAGWWTAALAVRHHRVVAGAAEPDAVGRHHPCR